MVVENELFICFYASNVFKWYFEYHYEGIPKFLNIFDCQLKIKKIQALTLQMWNPFNYGTHLFLEPQNVWLDKSPVLVVDFFM